MSATAKVVFNHYDEADCFGNVVTHSPQTTNICHTINLGSVKITSINGNCYRKLTSTVTDESDEMADHSCAVELFTDSQCSQQESDWNNVGGCENLVAGASGSQTQSYMMWCEEYGK